MMGLTRQADGEVDPVLVRAMDVLFMLHADHEQNCSTSALRNIASSEADPYCAVAGAAAALYGPLHGGANEAVLRMLAEIGDTKEIPAFLDRVKNREVRLMGFGHRVYKNYDPRAQIIKRVAYEVFAVTGSNPLIDIAVELEQHALEDDYFVSRRLYPNVDFYSGIIYQAMGFPVEMFPALFVLGRTPGWLAQWVELVTDSGAAHRPPPADLPGRGRARLRADRRTRLRRPCGPRSTRYRRGRARTVPSSPLAADGCAGRGLLAAALAQPPVPGSEVSILLRFAILMSGRPL